MESLCEHPRADKASIRALGEAQLSALVSEELPSGNYTLAEALAILERGTKNEVTREEWHCDAA